MKDVLSIRSQFATALAALTLAVVLAAPATAADAPKPDSLSAPATAAAPALAPVAVPTPTAAPASGTAAKAEKPAKAPKPPKVKKPRPGPPQAPWDPGATWLSVRAGYARAAYRNAPSGNVGFGFGVNRMLTPRVSLGGYAHYDVLGKFGNAVFSEAPFTLEIDRHYTMGPSFHPYLGAGGGVFYRKYAGTGADAGQPHGGMLLVIGGNSPVTPHQLLGIDVRMAFVSGDENNVNPVFGVEKASSVHWGAKLNWSYTY